MKLLNLSCLLFSLVGPAGAFVAPTTPHSRVASSLASTVEEETVAAVTKPKTTREQLIDISKSLGSDNVRYPQSWSNRCGTVLTPAAIPGVYTADRTFLWNDIDVGGRMTVIQLPDDGGLWVHSPVDLDEPLKKALANLGEVKHIVSPNYEHVKYAAQWAKAFPDATLWGCPGAKQQYPDIPWEKEIPSGTAPYKSNSEELWPGIEAIHIDVEVNPFTNKPFFNEVIFFHTASKSLITTDFFWNYPDDSGITNLGLVDKKGYKDVWDLAPTVASVPMGSKAWKFGMDAIYRPFYRNFMVRNDKELEYQTICDFILQKWYPIDTVIPCHGDLIRESPDQIKELLRDSMQV